MNADDSEELPENAKLTGNCSSCQRAKVCSQAGSAEIIMLTWTCVRPVPVVVPRCPGEPMATTPPVDDAKLPSICSEMMSRTVMESAKSETLLCSCCQDRCNEQAGCQLDFTKQQPSNNNNNDTESVTVLPQSSTNTTMEQFESTADVWETVATTARQHVVTNSTSEALPIGEGRCTELHRAAKIIAELCQNQEETSLVGE